MACVVIPTIRKLGNFDKHINLFEHIIGRSETKISIFKILAILVEKLATLRQNLTFDKNSAIILEIYPFFEQSKPL